MKKTILLLSLILFSFAAIAQAPQGFKYQTVVRNPSGAIYANKVVSLRISILQGTPSGTSVYSETHNTTTNDFGIVNINIGMGTLLSGNFASINWGADDYFVKTEIDMNGGTTFQFMGTSQLLSVPYALYAAKSANAADDYDKDSTNELQTVTKVGNTVTLSKGGGSFTDTDTDNQTLSLNGTQLHISNGNSITIGGTVDLDWDPTNELQSLSLAGDSLKISMGTGVLFPHDYDTDSTNELQTITKVGNTITLSNGGGNVIDDDNQNLSSSGTGTDRTINITGGTSTTINIADNDNDPTNELQTLSYSNDTLRLTQGNYVILPFSQIIPSGTCINSTSITPPSGYSYSGNSFETTDFWTLENNPPIIREGAKIAELNGKIYAIGGNYNSTDFNNTDEYDPVNRSWTSKATMPTPRRLNYLISCNSKLYAIGGYARKVEEYNPQSNGWLTKSDYPSNIIDLGNPAVCNNKIYFIGGDETAGVYEQKVLEFDPIANTWTSKTDMPTARAAFQMQVYNNQIYVFGGSSLNTLVVFDPLANLWTNKQPMNYARTSFTSCLANNKIYAFGGSNKKCEYYDISANTWNIITDMPASLTQLNAAFHVGDNIYIFGIVSSAVTNYKFDLNANNWLIKVPNPNTFDNGDMVFCNNLIYSYYGPTYSAIKFSFYKNGTTYYIHCKN